MKKRLVTTVIASIVSAICMFTFTACDNENKNAGTKVTEEVWMAAFDKTLNSENYTSILYDDYMEMSLESYIYFTADGWYNEGKENDSPIIPSVFYIRKDGQNYLIVNEYSGDVFEYEEDKANWEVTKLDETDDFDYLLFGGYCVYIVAVEYSTSQTDTEQKSIDKLYSAFAYSNGKYTAKLWVEEWPVHITVEINSDGYLVGFYIKGDGENPQTIGYTFSDFGTTSFTLPPEALDLLNQQ